VAALKLVVVDASAPLTDEDRALVAAAPAPRLVVVSKVDLPRAWPLLESQTDALETIEVSAITGAGLVDLRRAMVAKLTEREDLRDPPAITNARHLALVDEAREAMARAAAALDSGATEELVLTDLGRARGALEEITGRRSTDDLLTHIFARFCLGK
jgi:tRNA modification GTPase